MKYIINLTNKGDGDQALYKQDKLVLFDTSEQADPVAAALDATVEEVVPFGDNGWIYKDHFDSIDHTDLMNIYSEVKE